MDELESLVSLLAKELKSGEAVSPKEVQAPKPCKSSWFSAFAQCGCFKPCACGLNYFPSKGGMLPNEYLH